MSDAYPLGWLSRDQLRHEMAAARAVLFPARWQEPFGIVGAEALAMGTPVIARLTGGMSDWCESGTIQVSDRTEMTSAIRHLATNSDAAHALGEAGRTHIRTLCSPKSVHAQLEAVYQHLIAES
jgi:glycosyltransferase involved in cell wall biosynthesis